MATVITIAAIITITITGINIINIINMGISIKTTALTIGKLQDLFF
ncbi:MAG TPA: hypothetical protein VNN20_03000 [Thermodesulfobacteriota bacterium]|nr:hypothetical protein [Thermodesulfobacteriota bacterium]